MSEIILLQQLIRDVAHKHVMPYFLRTSSMRKEDGSPFTQADLSAQQALSSGLASIIDCPVLGEEMSVKQHKELWNQFNQTGLWVIDPIDGTTNFINGLPHFSISVALIRNGRSEIGVVYNPISDEMFYAQKGGGAYLNDNVLPLLSMDKTLKESIAAVEVKYLRSGKLASRIQNLSPCGSQRNMGCSTLDWCYLASGRFDVYLHGGQKLWDYAAGALILTEAGGYIDTLEGDDFWSGLHTFKRSAIASGQKNLFTLWTKWVHDNQ